LVYKFMRFSILCGIRVFTMSLFVGSLLSKVYSSEYLDSVKIRRIKCILFMSACFGRLWISLCRKKQEGSSVGCCKKCFFLCDFKSN